MVSSDRSKATCKFNRCSESIVGRVVMALVDQLCADADIDIALLDALEYPLGESVAALHRFEIRSATVHVESDELTVDIELAEPVPAVEVLLGDAGVVVESFFEVRRTADALGVALIGSWG